jgi:hypothetical protein
MKKLVMICAVVVTILAVSGVAQAVTIDGTISAGEWAGAATFTIQGGGTVSLQADQNYLYGAFDITGWLSSYSMNGNLLGFGAWKVNGAAGSSAGVEFQQATNKATWGGDGPSGVLNGLDSAFRIDSVLQSSIPVGLEAMDSFATGHRVWEVKMPINSMTVSAGDIIYVVGGINYSTTGGGANSNWYPGELLWGSYAPVTVVPEPMTLALLGLGGLLLRRKK